MKTNVIENKGICGVSIELTMFNVYQMQEMKKTLNEIVNNMSRYEEFKKLDYDELSDEEQKEFDALITQLNQTDIKRLNAMFNNMLKDFSEEHEDDLFTEPKTEKENATPIGTRENPRMFEDTTFG